MTDIAEIQLKIKAVEFALKSFARFSDEQQRKDHLRSQFDNVQNLDTYFGFSEFELKDALNKQWDQKNLLLEKENLLLALQQGGVFICECLNPAITRFFLVGAKLGDGLPELVQNLTLSPPSVPPEKEHASCQRIVSDLPFSTAESVNISGATNTVWRKARTRADGSRYLLYSSEDDIVYFVRRFMEDILLALGLSLDFNSEVTIKQIRPDLCVLLLDMYLVGVVEVKKPGGDILLEPTVLGESLDQMLLVEGFYGMGPVIGILTT